MLIAGALMTNKPNTGQAGPATVVTVKGLARLWCRCWSCFDLPPVAFLSQVLFAGGLEGGDSLVNSIAPKSASAARADDWLQSIWQTLRDFLRESLYLFFGAPLSWWLEESSPYRVILGRRWSSILETCPAQRSCAFSSMASILAIIACSRTSTLLT